MSQCWEWEGCIQSNGYGRITNQRRTQYAHRFMWEAFNGPIPNGFDVCHTCDNRKCVNPGHLFLGSRHDNMRDAVIKNRVQRGEDRYNAVLTEEIVREARRQRQRGKMVKDIAQEMGVPSYTLAPAIRGKTWSHVL